MKRVSIPVALIMAALVTNCWFPGVESTEEAEKQSQNQLLLGLLAGTALESGKDFALNGVWDSYFGSGTSTTTITTISAKSGTTGLWLDDDSSYSSCVRIIQFNNAEGVAITQNPSQNGACFSSDPNKGKYNKVLFFPSTYNGKDVFWNCTIAFGKDTVQAALDAEDTSNRTSPESSGCGSSPWSRLEARAE
ncbi:MAG: hypothetical protein CMN76_19745 [Spirochaetaceae bacterium]|nr:hypothetical protein [Spirochaetaceae bacterium]|tara:strand:+ start:8606 stop:9181 length:576 start_codon:yes stop_codon:yes gene_type:complete